MIKDIFQCITECCHTYIPSKPVSSIPSFDLQGRYFSECFISSVNIVLNLELYLLEHLYPFHPQVFVPLRGTLLQTLSDVFLEYQQLLSLMRLVVSERSCKMNKVATRYPRFLCR